MKIRVYIEKEEKNKTVSLDGPNVKNLLKKLNINPVTVIVTKNNEVCTEETKISQKDEIKILSVVSGG